jgi:uncharacterized repeat protein (TIGR01451 family)
VTVALDADLTGTTATYELEVTNLGPDTAEDVTAVLVLPASVTLVSLAPDTGTCAPATDPGVHVCTLGDLGADGSVGILATGQATGAPGDPLTALASASSPTVDPAGHTNSAVASP